MGGEVETELPMYRGVPGVLIAVGFDGSRFQSLFEWLIEHPEAYMTVAFLVFGWVMIIVFTFFVMLGFVMGRKTLVLPKDPEPKVPKPGPRVIERLEDDPWEAAMRESPEARIPTVPEG